MLFPFPSLKDSPVQNKSLDREIPIQNEELFENCETQLFVFLFSENILKRTDAIRFPKGERNIPPPFSH